MKKNKSSRNLDKPFRRSLNKGVTTTTFFQLRRRTLERSFLHKCNLIKTLSHPRRKTFANHRFLNLSTKNSFVMQMMNSANYIFFRFTRRKTSQNVLIRYTTTTVKQMETGGINCTGIHLGYEN